MVRQSVAFSPCNITGFFTIHDRSLDVLRVGSTGAGVALAQGVITRLMILKARRSKVSVTFNKRPLDSAIVSRRVAQAFLTLDCRAWDVRVSHECPLPIGCGYGTSGAAALGLSFAMNDAMGLSLTLVEAGGIAHACEVRCKTGLGTVASVFFGGFTVRTEPGAPGVGVVKTIRAPSSLRVVSASFGPVSTREVLGDSSMKVRINYCSRSLVSKLLRETTSAEFISLSRRFADCVGLISKRLARVSNILEENSVSCSMMMLGESLFCVIPSDRVPLARGIIEREGLTPVVSEVAKSGAAII